jgi:adenosylmethionine-8-amino-7-oxononanoate aminotransferase
MFDALGAACCEGAAAFIGDPLVLGSGGMMIYSSETSAEIYLICVAQGPLFIADEVMTGWARRNASRPRSGVRYLYLLCRPQGVTGGVIRLVVTMASKAIYRKRYSTDRSNRFFRVSS